jgi:hypothetical protein
LPLHPAVAYLLCVRPMRHLITALILVAGTYTAAEAKERKLWMTGEVISRDGVMMFRADKPVPGNSMGNIVLVGGTTDAKSVVGPLLMRAWERHIKMRLYGELQPANPPLPGHRGKLPNLQFIVWKFHVPTDPDKLPPGEAIHLDPQTKIPGYRVSPP